MKYWEIIADKLSKAGWSLGWVSAIDSNGRTIWIADAHRGDGKRFIVQADEIADGVPGTFTGANRICLCISTRQIKPRCFPAHRFEDPDIAGLHMAAVEPKRRFSGR